MRENIESLGKALMKAVRDKSLEVTSRRLHRTPPHPTEEWMSAYNALDEDQRRFVDRLLRLHTDQVIAGFLGLLEDDTRFQLMVSNSQGRQFNAVDEGDGLSAALFGRRGWIARFSVNPPEGM